MAYNIIPFGIAAYLVSPPVAHPTRY